MTEKRKYEREEHTWFRSERVFQVQGQWYFYTREGEVEGPFVDDVRTRGKLEAYTRTMGSKFAPNDELELVPEEV